LSIIAPCWLRRFVVAEMRGVPSYRIEFFADEDGTRPMRRWLESLPRPARSHIGFMMWEHLQRDGPNVAETQFGKNLGGGLYEFRLDGELNSDRVLYRIFFHVYGDRIVLLLHAYDKGQRPSDRYQNEMIETARRRLREFQRRQREA
jgi:phage-related protein